MCAAPRDPKRFHDFVGYVHEHLSGDEKGEAQIYLDRLFQAFGQGGVKEAGATLEMRIKKRDQGGTAFADLVWKPTVLIEMKKRGTDLSRHLVQASEYWVELVPNRPQYVVLCNFDEFWVYDFNVDISEPLDVLKLEDLPERYGPLAFLFPTDEKPVFEVDRLKVTRTAADLLSACYRKLAVRRDIGLQTAQRFVLQMLVALFSEDIGLLPKYFVTRLLDECTDRDKSFDLLGGLFKAMATEGGVKGGRYKGIDYFNGGLFEHPAPVELASDELYILKNAAKEDWSHVSPDIFGTIFQHSMDEDERHALGAHYTTPADIMKIVGPTIVRPWREAIARADSIKQLGRLRQRLHGFRVLDPACGSGNFLYIAYRELKRLEIELDDKIKAISTTAKDKHQFEIGFVSSKQFFGMDIVPFAVELAKVTLTLAHKLSIDELHIEESPLPLDNLDANIVCTDGLIHSESAGLGGDQVAWRTPLLDADGHPIRTNWPAADVIIGNPPFNGAKKLKPDFGPDYVNAVRKAYPGVPGMADYCVHWFRRSHDEAPVCTPGDPLAGRVGLVGTQNVRNNKSREGGLDHVASSGVIVEAVENQPWSGEANVHVSIANWVKLGPSPAAGGGGGPPKAGRRGSSLPREAEQAILIPPKRRLWTKIDPKLELFDDAQGEGTKRKTTRVTGKRGKVRLDKSFELRLSEVEHINSALSDQTDVSPAVRLKCNTKPQKIFRGFEPGNLGFLLKPALARKLIADVPSSIAVIHPYLTGREMVTGDGTPSRYLIDFQRMTIPEAQQYQDAFQHVHDYVLPQMKAIASKKSADAEFTERASKMKLVARLENWWQLRRCVSETAQMLTTLDRYIVCSLVTKRPIFVFQSSDTFPSNLLQSFAFPDDYSFGLFQSDTHWQWFVAKCSKLTERFRYTPRSVFDTFPWPQKPTKKQVRDIAAAGREVRRLRDEILPTLGGGLRKLYRTLEDPGKHPLKDAHAALDAAVLKAYGFDAKGDRLAQLLELNLAVSAKEQAGEPVTPPGVPPTYGDAADLITEDCIKP